MKPYIDLQKSYCLAESNRHPVMVIFIFFIKIILFYMYTLPLFHVVVWIMNYIKKSGQ